MAFDSERGTVPPAQRGEPACKGSVFLGTGCMRCSRCYEEMPRLIERLRIAVDQLRDAAVYCSAALANSQLADEAELKLKTALDETRDVRRKPR